MNAQVLVNTSRTLKPHVHAHSNISTQALRLSRTHDLKFYTMSISLKYIPLLSFLLFSFFASAQEIPDVDNGELESGVLELSEVGTFPYLNGCESSDVNEQWRCTYQKIQMHIAENFEFPDAARSGPGGRVWINFEINASGDVVNVSVARSSGVPSIDAEGVRAVGTLPRFAPATVDGEPVRMSFHLPITANTGNDG